MFDVYGDLPDFSQSIRRDIHGDILWRKCLVVYHLSIIIGMIYAWHCTIRFLSSLLVFVSLTGIIVGTDLVLYSYQIAPISYSVCAMLIFTFAVLEVFVSHYVPDPLNVLREYDSPWNKRYEYLQNDTSTSPRFYRWAKKMNKRWNIEEEKLNMTTIVDIIISGICIIFVYVIFHLAHRK